MKLVIYIYKKIIPIFLGSVFFFALVLNLVDLFINISKYLQLGAPVSAVLKVMELYIPKTVWYSIPVGILFATSYSLSDLYASNELEALFASGVSLFRFTLPILILSIALSFGMFVFENKVVVQTYEQKQTLQNEILHVQTNADNSKIIVISENSKIIYEAKRYSDATHRLEDLYIVFRNEDKSLQAIIYTPKAHWNDETQLWDLENPVQYEYKKNEKDLVMVNCSKELKQRLNESYEIFRRNTVDVDSVNTTDAKIYIDHLKKAGLPYQEQLSVYYKKFAFPFIVFIVVFLSIGLTGKTKKNVLLISLASSISSAVLFYVFQMVTMILAKFGILNPFMGAWLPVFVFTILSIILLKFSRT